MKYIYKTSDLYKNIIYEQNSNHKTCVSSVDGTANYHKRRAVNMNITDIKIRKIIPEGRLRAIISITIDDMIAIHDIKVVQGDERLFVAMPSRRDENGMFRDIVHPISPEARGIIESQILDAYVRHIDLMQAELEAEQTGNSLF